MKGISMFFSDVWNLYFTIFKYNCIDIATMVLTRGQLLIDSDWEEVNSTDIKPQILACITLCDQKCVHQAWFYQ